MSDTPRRPGYNAAIDGLRGIAILGVWLFHLHPPLLPGGFLGVDAFFVLNPDYEGNDRDRTALGLAKPGDSWQDARPAAPRRVAPHALQPQSHRCA